MGTKIIAVILLCISVFFGGTVESLAPSEPAESISCYVCEAEETVETEHLYFLE